MKVLFHVNFKKRYKKLRLNERKQFNARLSIFMESPLAPILNNHALHGKYAACRSINIAGDLRAIYKLIDADTAYFIAIDTHGNLYK